MVHPDIELRYIDDRMGYGLFAKRFIPRGTITWARDDLDRAFTLKEIAALSPFYQGIIDTYTFVDRRGDHILCWDLSRFMNHSCEPASMYAGLEFEIALRDLQAGDELTDDYGTLNLSEPFDCSCMRPGCRGQVLPNDLEAYGDRWDAQVRAAFPLVGTVDQPLFHLVKDPEAVRAAIANPALVPSVRENSAGRQEIITFRS